MKGADKLRAIAILMWIAGGAITFDSNPIVSLLTIAAGVLFGVSLIVDVADENPDDIWHREGFYYVARAAWNTNRGQVTRERKLDFFSYNLIRWIHGDQVLKEIALKD